MYISNKSKCGIWKNIRYLFSQLNDDNMEFEKEKTELIDELKKKIGDENEETDEVDENDQEDVVDNSMELEMVQDGNSIFWSWIGGPSNSEKKIELDIDLNDPDVADAVTKIQAGFRASQARKLAEEAKSKTGHNGAQCFKNPEKMQFTATCTIS